MGLVELLLTFVFGAGLAIGVGVTPVAKSPIEFFVARVCLIVACVIPLVAFLLWLYEGPHPQTASIPLGICAGLILLFGLPFAMWWVNHRQKTRSNDDLPTKSGDSQRIQIDGDGNSVARDIHAQVVNFGSNALDSPGRSSPGAPSDLMPINDLFKAIDSRVLDARKKFPWYKNRWEIVGEKIMDKFSLGLLRCWARKPKPNKLAFPYAPPLEIPKEYWHTGEVRFTYSFFDKENPDKPHTMILREKGNELYDIQVSSAEADQVFGLTEKRARKNRTPRI